jgi:Domain of unknown function (DUF1906)
MTIEIIDSAGDVTRHLPALKAQGVRTVIRYLSGDTRPFSKNGKPPEARAIAAKGMRLGLVYETYGGTHHELNAAVGVAHAKQAIAQAKALGAPDGACIYFACDTNPVGAEFTRVMEYLASVKATINANSKYRVGVYGPGDVCEAALDNGHVDLAWLANAHGWSGFHKFFASKRWALFQHLPAHVGGISCDPDEAAPGVDWGDFVPYAHLATGEQPADSGDDADPQFKGPPHDLKWMQSVMAENGVDPDPGPADGVFGEKTEKALAAVVEGYGELAGWFAGA